MSYPYWIDGGVSLRQYPGKRADVQPRCISDEEIIRVTEQAALLRRQIVENFGNPTLADEFAKRLLIQEFGFFWDIS